MFIFAICIIVKSKDNVIIPPNNKVMFPFATSSRDVANVESFVRI